MLESLPSDQLYYIMILKSITKYISVFIHICYIDKTFGNCSVETWKGQIENAAAKWLIKPKHFVVALSAKKQSEISVINQTDKMSSNRSELTISNFERFATKTVTSRRTLSSFL